MANVLFDLDGTLVDSAPALARVGNALNAELGRAPVDPVLYARFIGQGIPRQVEQLLEHGGGVPGGALAPHLARFRDLHDADPVSDATIYPGVNSALTALRAGGHVLAIVTQKDLEPARRMVGGMGLSPHFDWLTGGGSLDVLKPDPRMITETLKHLPPGPSIFVGDSGVDAECARRAGVPFLLHAAGYGATKGEDVPCLARFTAWADVPDLVEVALATGFGADLNSGALPPPHG